MSDTCGQRRGTSGQPATGPANGTSLSCFLLGHQVVQGEPFLRSENFAGWLTESLESRKNVNLGGREMTCLLFSFAPFIMLHERGQGFWVNPSLFASQRSMKNRICFRMGIERTKSKEKRELSYCLGGSRMIYSPWEH